VRALPFYTKTEEKAPLASTHTESWSHAIHRLHPNEHVGSVNKMLRPYDPSAPRSRLLKVEDKYMESNASQIGDLHRKRSPQDLLNLTTTYRTFYTHPLYRKK
jgi:hypothetical protein